MTAVITCSAPNVKSFLVGDVVNYGTLMITVMTVTGTKTLNLNGTLSTIGSIIHQGGTTKAINHFPTTLSLKENGTDSLNSNTIY
jgi:hypothetical protein